MDNLTDIVLLISVCTNALLIYLLDKCRMQLDTSTTKKNLILFHLYMREYLSGLAIDNCSYLHELNAVGHAYTVSDPVLTKVCSQIVLEHPQYTSPFPFVSRSI